MPLRVLNDYVLVEPCANHFVDTNAEVVRIAEEGLIQLPEQNSLERRANTGKVVSCGPRCIYPFKLDQKVYFKQWDVNSCYHYESGKRFRFFVEHEIIAVEE